jgi:hypothetical protein
VGVLRCALTGGEVVDADHRHFDHSLHTRLLADLVQVAVGRR